MPMARAVATFGLQSLRRIVSTHVLPGYVLQAVQQLDATFARLVYVASGPHLAAMIQAATPTPAYDATEFDAEELALAVAKTLGLDDTIVFGRVLLVQANARTAILSADARLNRAAGATGRPWLRHSGFASSAMPNSKRRCKSTVLALKVG